VEDSTDGITYNPAATLGARLGSADITGLNASSFYYFRVRAYNAYRGLAYSAYSNAAGVATTPEPDNVDFSGGFAGSMPQLNYEGNASLVSGSVAQLTDGGGSESGAIWVQQLHDIERFDTEFTFQITPDGAGFADGLTFCIQDISPTATGASGGGLGYAGIRKSIAIKFDVYPDVSTTGLYTDGAQSNNAAPPAIDAGPSGINFQSGDIFDVRLTYIYGVLTETLTDTVTNAVFTHQYKISIPNHLAGDQGYIGFTGGTGGETSIQQILSWAFVTLPNNVPPAPSRLKAAPASSSQINLTWKDNAANETGFLVERRTSGSSAWSVMGVLPANTVTYSDTALTANTRYSYIVRAVNAAGQSAASNHAEATTPAVPAAPADFEATAITLGEVDLQWTNAGQDARNFIVSRQEAGSGRHTVLATLPADARSYADKTASAGAHYTYRLQASNMAGPSRSSAVEVTMPGR
jgi:hypothetical protein